MTAESQKIGPGRCPVCGSGKARYTLSKKGLICVTCDACNVQVFARSERSDELLRANIKPAAPAAAAAPEPAAVEVKKTLPAEPTPAAQAVTEKPKRTSLMQW